MANWWEAGGSIPSINCKEHVENPTRGQAYAGGSITGAWTVAVRALLVNMGGQQGIFDSTTGRMFIGWASGTQRGWYNGTWQNLDLFPLNQEVVVFIVSNGTTIQSYSDGVAVGSAIAATQDISGTTRWRSDMAGTGSFWKASVPAGAVYDIALDATQRAKLLYQMRIIEPIRTSVVYNASTTFTAPADVTEIIAEAWGGGGSGATKTNGGGYGSGGGGGAYARSLIPVTPGNNYTVTVGAGATRPGSTAAGSPGGTSQLIGDGAVSVVAEGGRGGSQTNGVGTAGGGTTVSVGNQAEFAGGGSGAASTGTGGAGNRGGGAAGDQGAGQAGSIGSGGGAGGTHFGGAGGPGGPIGPGNATAGTAPGGGGGGNGVYSQFVNEQRFGGNGAVGRIVVTYAFPFPLLPTGKERIARGVQRGTGRGAR